jgi:hypothetical protein
MSWFTRTPTDVLIRSGCFRYASGGVRIEAATATPRSRNPDLIGLSIGAGEGIRTLDPDLGKVMVYADCSFALCKGERVWVDCKSALGFHVLTRVIC